MISEVVGDIRALLKPINDKIREYDEIVYQDLRAREEIFGKVKEKRGDLVQALDNFCLKNYKAREKEVKQAIVLDHSKFMEIVEDENDKQYASMLVNYQIVDSSLPPLRVSIQNKKFSWYKPVVTELIDWTCSDCKTKNSFMNKARGDSAFKRASCSECGLNHTYHTKELLVEYKEIENLADDIFQLIQDQQSNFSAEVLDNKTDSELYSLYHGYRFKHKKAVRYWLETWREYPKSSKEYEDIRKWGLQKNLWVDFGSGSFPIV